MRDLLNNLNTKYRSEIDGLRAFAVLAVIINHFNEKILPSGYLGVDIFFVISGYVITSSLSKRSKSNLFEFLCHFYERRIKRLVPALIVFVLITSLIICILNPSPGYSLWAGIYSLFGLSNIELYNTSVDYFAPDTKLNVFTHTWSLGVEEQFYFLFPFLVWFSGFGVSRKGDKKFLFIILFLSIVSLSIFLWFQQINQPAAYFLMPSRFWEMAMGSITFLLFRKDYIFKKYFKQLSPFFLLALISITLFLPVSFASFTTISIVFLTSLLILNIEKEDLFFSILTNQKIKFIGLISYSLYLWHWGVLSLSRWTIGISWWTIPFQFFVIFLLSLVSYKYIEQPFRKGDFNFKRFQILFYGITSSFISALLIIVIGGPLRKNLYLGKFNFDDFTKLEEVYNSQTSDDLSKYMPIEEEKAIFIIGDSHAFNLYPSLKESTNKFSFKKFFYCSIKTNNDIFCNEELLAKTDKISKDDLLLFSVRAYFNDFEKVKSTIEILKKISNKTKAKLILVDDLTPFGDNYDGDFFPKFTFFGDGPEISRELAEKKRLKHTKFLLNYENKLNIFYIDPLTKVCNPKICKAVINDVLIYADGSPHFNKEGAYILNDLWEENIPKIIKSKK